MSGNRVPGLVPGGARSGALERNGLFRIWLVFAGAVVVSIFVHEVGHCAVAWGYGCPAIPTFAKEYILGPLPDEVQNPVALGGMVGILSSPAGVGDLALSPARGDALGRAGGGDGPARLLCAAVFPGGSGA